MNPDKSLYAEKPRAYFSSARTEIHSLLPETATRVLEIGCGSGATMKWLRGERTVKHAVGIEIAPEAGQEAASVFDMVLSGNVETMELPTGDFDLIIALDVLEHLVDPWSLVKRLHAILGPDGAIIVSVPNVSHYFVSLPLILRGQWNYNGEGLLDRTHLRFFTPQTSQELMTCSGLKVDKVEYMRIWPGMESRSRRWRWYSAKMLNLILPSHLFEYQFLIRM